MTNQHSTQSGAASPSKRSRAASTSFGIIAAFSLLLCLGVAIHSADARKKKPDPDKPKEIEVRRRETSKIPSYNLPFPGTYNLSRTYQFPHMRQWTIPEAQLRSRIAIDAKNKLPDLPLRVSELLFVPAELAGTEGAAPSGSPVDTSEVSDGATGALVANEATKDLDPIYREYHQTIEMNKQYIPEAWTKQQLTVLTLNLTKKAKLLKFELIGQDLSLSVSKEGYPGAILEDGDILNYHKEGKVGSPDLDLYAETGVYSVKVTVERKRPTRFTLRCTYWPAELPPTPPPVSTGTPVDGGAGATVEGAPPEEGAAEVTPEPAPEEGGAEGESQAYEEESGQ